MNWLEKNYVKYGLIMSGVTAVCLLLMELTGQNESFDNKSPFTIIFLFIAPFIVWWLGIKARKEKQKNKLTFKQGVVEGFKISFVYGIISPFVFLLYYILLNPSIISYVREAYQMTGASDAMVIGVDMGVQFVSAIVFGTIYAAIVSFFLKSKA